MLKPSIQGVQVLVPLEDLPPEATPHPLIPLAESLKFTFGLQLKHPDFVSFTQLDPEYQGNGSLYVFSHAASDANNPMDTSDPPPSTKSATASTELTATVVQRAALSPTAAPTPQDQTGIRTPTQIATQVAEWQTLLHRNLFGVVEIQPNVNPTRPLGTGQEFTITFAPRQQVWTYYLVAAPDTPPTAFAIQDKDAEISFAITELDECDRILTAIQTRFPQSQAIRLQSSTPVTCRETRRPHLQLFKQGQSKPWIPHLPNPPNQHGTQVINVLEDV